MSHICRQYSLLFKPYCFHFQQLYFSPNHIVFGNKQINCPPFPQKVLYHNDIISFSTHFGSSLKYILFFSDTFAFSTKHYYIFFRPFWLLSESYNLLFQTFWLPAQSYFLSLLFKPLLGHLDFSL